MNLYSNWQKIHLNKNNVLFSYYDIAIPNRVRYLNTNSFSSTTSPNKLQPTKARHMLVQVAAGKNCPRVKQTKCNSEGVMLFLFQHNSCFTFLFFFVNLLLTPVKAYLTIYNSSSEKNEILVWNSKMQVDFIFCLVVLVIIVLHIFYLYSKQDTDAINR